MYNVCPECNAQSYWNPSCWLCSTAQALEARGYKVIFDMDRVIINECASEKYIKDKFKT